MKTNSEILIEGNEQKIIDYLLESKLFHGVYIIRDMWHFNILVGDILIKQYSAVSRIKTSIDGIVQTPAHMETIYKIYKLMNEFWKLIYNQKYIKEAEIFTFLVRLKELE